MRDVGAEGRVTEVEAYWHAAHHLARMQQLPQLAVVDLLKT